MRPLKVGSRFADLAVLGVILFVALLFRVNGLDWDSGTHQHPDERFLTDVASRVQVPSSLDEYFSTARSPLNPYARGFNQYAYGQLPLTLARIGGEITGNTGYDSIYLVGRGLSVAADLATVLFTWLLARQIFGRSPRIAHIAAALLAVTVLHIQLAHFFTVDTFASAFCAASLYFGQRAWQRQSLTNTALAGVMVGLATASKISALILLPVLAVAFFWPRVAGGWRNWKNTAQDGATMLAVALVAALVTFRIAEPYAFAGTAPWNFRLSQAWLADKAYWTSVSSGAVDVPYMIQWAGTSPYSFVLQATVQWGAGPALGIASLFGGILLGWRFLRGEPGAREGLLVLVWAAANFLYFGGQFAKFLRYVLPMYFALAIFAAYGLVSLVGWTRGPLRYRLPRFATPVALVVATAVPALAAAWALAFSAVYAQPHSRIQASEWIYTNISPGKTLATEHWDDRLPLTLGAGKDGGRYRYVDLPLYDPENAGKRERIAQALDQTDYVVLASRRLVDSIPRLPERYPLGSAYYRLLFSGDLGFERVAQIQVTPSMGPIRIDDSRAQEDFTVYDHPTVEIWAKKPSYSSSDVRQLLGSVSLDRVSNVRPVDAGKGSLLLAPDERQLAESAGTWSSLFDRDGFANRLPLPVWILTAEVIALTAVPLLWRTLRFLPDRGFGASKIIGLALVAYVPWLLASATRVLPFGRGTILLALLLLATASAMVVTRHRRALLEWLRRERRLLIAVEAVFLLGTTLFLGIRAANPDLWHPVFGGEKPMNFAYLNAVVKSDYFPPYDPWFAGGYINYYYFSFVLVAALVKLTGIEPQLAFNLAQPTFYAALCAGVFSLAFTLAVPLRAVRRGAGYLAGGAAVVIVAVLGNLDAGLQLLDQVAHIGAQRAPDSSGLARLREGLAYMLTGHGIPPLDFWRSTRFIGPEDAGPIHEFPYFTFLYGDLHAHQLSLPITVAVLLVSVSLMRAVRHEPLKLHWAGLGLGALLVGMLRASNTWDFPTYAAIACGALALGYLPLFRRLPRAGLVRLIVSAGALVVSSQLFFWPWLERYQLFYTGVDPVQAKTALGQYLTIQGFFYFVTGSLMVWLAVRALRTRAVTASLRRQPLPEPEGMYAYGVLAPLPVLRRWTLPSTIAVFGLLLGAAFTVAGYSTRGVIVAALGAASAMGVATWRRQNVAFVAGLLTVGFGVTLVPEFVALQGDVGRMNTVFKFYFQAWLLLGIGSAVALAWLVRAARQEPVLTGWRLPWGMVAAVLGLAALSYPLFASESKVGLRFAQIGPGLDGMAYMDSARYTDRDRDLNLPGDANAIRWLQDTVQGSPPILEGRAPVYRWGSRVSVYTGLPTVLGWDVHQSQQRVAYSQMLQERITDVQRAYDSQNPAEALAVIRKYGIRYVYVGGLERAYYAQSGLEKLRSMPELRLAYDREGVQIYEVLT